MGCQKGNGGKMKFTMYSQFSDIVSKRGIEYAAKYAVELGFSSVEIFANADKPESYAIADIASAKHARHVLEEAGLTVACYSVYVDLLENEEGEKELMKHVEFAAQIGSPYLHHTLIPENELLENVSENEKMINLIVDAAGRIADFAAQFGIVCIYEDQGNYVNGIKGFGNFWNKMKQRSRNVGICGDLGNILFVNETPETFLRTYVKDIYHVHVKDYLWKKASISPGRYWQKAKEDNWLRDTMIGSGVVDFETCLQVLKSGGYQGSYALEIDHPEPFEEGVYQAVEYLKRLY